MQVSVLCYVHHGLLAAATGTVAVRPILQPTGVSTTHINNNSILIEQCNTVHAMNLKAAARQYSILANYIVILDHIAYAPQQLGTVISSATYRS